MAYLCSQRAPNIQIKYFMFDWWIYRLFALNKTLKRNSVQMMIFVNVCSTWSLVYIKDTFWYVSNKRWRKWCKFVSTFSFNNTYGLPVLTMDTRCPNQLFYVWLVDLHTICAKLCLETFSLQIMIFVCFPDLRHIWTKYAFWDVNIKKWRKWCKYVSPS
jgi:hypothetical protein